MHARRTSQPTVADRPTKSGHEPSGTPKLWHHEWSARPKELVAGVEAGEASG